MKHYNLLCGMILTLMLISFLAIPQKIFAAESSFFNFGGSEDYQVLSEFEAQKIFSNFSEILFRKWTLLSVDGYSDPKEKTTISLLREITNLNVFNYYFRDLPVDVSLSVAKQSIEISKLIATEDVSGILGKIEKETAKVAVNYLKEYFFKNQIKVSFGAMEVKYKTELGNVDSPFQYIIMYQPINNEKGKVVARIYSPKEIIPPASRGSYGGSKGFFNSLEPGQNIPPFIVEISGEMVKGMYGSYVWNGSPEIKTIFPAKVPDFDLKPRTWQDKYIVNPIKEGLSSVLSLTQLFGFQTEAVDYLLKEGDTEKIEEEIKDIKEGSDVKEEYPEEKEEEIKIVKQEIQEIQEIKEKAEKEETKIKAEEKVKKEEKAVFSSCSKDIPYAPKHNIVFNEVAWMGSKSSANDEWMELKNISDQEINLKGYTISDKGEQMKIVFDDYVLPSGSFVLLERTDDTSVPSKTADLIYQGALSNNSEELYLFDSSCHAEDYILANPDWPAGDNTERRTMERQIDFTWLTYSGNGINEILGTPKEANSLGMIIKKESKKEKDSNSISLAASEVGGGAITGINYCSQSNLSSPTHQVVINELAWMGSEASSTDEWIELKNLSETDIDLNNWQLLDQSNQIKVVFSLETISPDSFYLLERTNDESVPNIVADKIYSGSWALSDSNESLRLFDPNCNLVDEVLADPDWPAGDKKDKKTMERGEDLSWHTYSSVIDANNGLWGTPKAANSIEEEYNQEDDPSQDDPIQEDEEEEIVDVPLLITEVQTDGENGYEYIELFNQSDEEIELCSDEKHCFYLSYYSSNSNWSDPYRNWKFLEGEVISADSYYIVDVFGNTLGDWRLETNDTTEGDVYYKRGQLADNGSLAVFSSNPKYTGEKEKNDEEQLSRSISLKIDAVGWGNSETMVKESQQFAGIKTGKVLGRKWVAGEYLDVDNNFDDFQLEIPSPRDHAPRPPEKVQDLSASLDPEQKNSLILSWSAAKDEDSDEEDISYEIYYSRNKEIDESNLSKIDSYVSFEIVDSGENTKKATISDLYYSSDYYFAVKAKDLQENYSPLSDVVLSQIGDAIHQKQAPYYDFMRTGRSVFAGPTVSNPGEGVVVVQGSDSNTNNDSLSSVSAIDENGTFYFYGLLDGVYGIYAYNSNVKKWVYPVTGNDPSLGKDGSIYFASEQSIYCLSPSGKLEWQENFEKVYTKNISIDSEGKLYFVASKQPDNAALFVFDGETAVPIYTIGSLLNIGYSELVINNKDYIYFSKGNTVFKFDQSGKINEMSFDVQYSSDYFERDKTGKTEQVYVALDGTVLVNVYQGWCCYNNGHSQLDVLYAIDNDLKKVIWSKVEYGSIAAIGDGEFYLSFMRAGMAPFWEISSIDLIDGHVKWKKIWTAQGSFSHPSIITLDEKSNLYFTKDNGVLGYDSSNITDTDSNTNKILSFSAAQSYCYNPVSLGDGIMYISRFDRITAIKY